MNNGGIYTKDKCLITTKTNAQIRFSWFITLMFLFEFAGEKYWKKHLMMRCTLRWMHESWPEATPLNITSFPNINLLGPSKIFLEEILTLKKIISFWTEKEVVCTLKPNQTKQNKTKLISPSWGIHIDFNTWVLWFQRSNSRKNCGCSGLCRTLQVLSVFSTYHSISSPHT